MPAEQILQTSIENLEYELLRGLKDLVQEGGAAIGMLMSRGEMAEDEGFGLVEALSEEFEVFKVPLEQANRVEDLDPFDVLLIMGPKEAYTERERYFLDQYLMRGGHLVFALDALAFDPDALSAPEGTIAMPFDHGFDQMLFRYGVRINKDLVQDLNFGLLPVYGGNFGNQEQLVPLPWPFYVRVTQLAKHPVTKGLDPLLVRYVSSLDTVKAEGVRKTPLLFSSPYSFREAAPVRLALSDAERAPDVERFQAGSLPLMYLLEGEFTSFYKNRFLPEGVDAAGFLEQGSRGRVLVTGSGSWFKSQRIGEGQAPLALGQSPLQVEDYDNRRFVQHLMQYLLEPEGMIASRAKEFRVRPLDKVRVQEERRYWQGVNVLLPPLLMVLLGLGLVQLRRMRYARR
ncbi:gliding motility-associated ABC transporter substrate-binding protein GldG [Nitritalea halalkaliphila]|uniref:gliding motility-associated ABC transporter substrate-binding protein GldG n=1 Tax=Nitritalea halalkaliphila TaxID=590849 RepID=UPI0002FFEE2E|nr:gliding motility-associated ABC transporter substrate-binding protein GldG [Nitritalea halalkaliphila]